MQYSHTPLSSNMRNPVFTTNPRQLPHLDLFGREEGRGMATAPFPADIEYSILLRLPVKSLRRFQCVCKLWFSLISSPLFQNDHLRIAQHKPPLLLTLMFEGGYHGVWDNLTLHFSTYNNSNRQGSFTLLNNFSITLTELCYKPYTHSCLGLVLLISNFCQPMHISNPSTEDLISLPLPTEGPTFSVGFGFAASIQEFKVVRLYRGGDKCRTEVLTLGTSHWRQVRDPVHIVDFGSTPFLHGAVHFQPTIPYPDEMETDRSCRITVFDIDTEEYREGIPLPASYYSSGKWEDHVIPSSGEFLHLSKLGGSLCLTFDYSQLKCYLELWILKDYNNAEWVKGYTIDISTIFPNPSDSLSVDPADTTGDDILLNCFNDEGFKILGYNIRDGSLSLKKDNEWAATSYMETFYPLRRSRYAERQGVNVLADIDVPGHAL